MNKTNTLPQKDGPAETLRSGVWLGVPPKPYYADEWVTIYHADSRNLLPMLADYVLITDPLYGVNLGATKGTGGAHWLVKGAY